MHRQSQRPHWLPAAGLMLGIGAALLGSLYSARSFAAEDAYTRAIREEGTRLGSLKRPAADEAPAEEAKDVKSPAKVPAEFENMLRTVAPASHRFYTELEAASRQKVYAMYLKEGKVNDEVKRLIVKLRLGS